MNNIENYPLAPALDALRTVTGRVVLVFAATLFGIALGGITATHAVSGAWGALTSFMVWAPTSFIVSVGAITFPAALLFAVLFIRSGWPLWTVSAVALLIWWNAHKTIHWTIHESAGAKVQKQMDAMVEEISKRHQELQKPH